MRGYSCSRDATDTAKDALSIFPDLTEAYLLLAREQVDVSLALDFYHAAASTSERAFKVWLEAINVHGMRGQKLFHVSLCCFKWLLFLLLLLYLP